MKRFALVLTAFMLVFNGFAQNNAKYTENDVKQFYRTLQGDYNIAINDSTTAIAHFTPIWEERGDRFQWLYLEASVGKEVILQKVLEVKPKNEKNFKVVVHDLKDPSQFVSKWGNRNYFDGFTTSILKSGRTISFFKTSDFSYQSQWSRYKAISCFPKGDLLHFKFVQEEERFYIKRMPNGTDRILGYQGIKEPTD